jgi:DnaJ-class molecular chaperone
MKRSFYEMIGVPHDANQATIDVAYTQVMGRLNDAVKRGAAEASMEAQLVRDGYQILSDPAKRSMYDAKLSASEHGVQLMFFPEDKHAQRKLGVQSVVFALLASTFVGVVFWQMNRKVNEVRADYATVVVRKQAAQNVPKVIETNQSGQDKPIVVESARAEPILKNSGSPENETKH